MNAIQCLGCAKGRVMGDWIEGVDECTVNCEHWPIEVACPHREIQDLTEIEPSCYRIVDSLGLPWTYHPNFWGFGMGKVMMDYDPSGPEGGYPCASFREAVAELLDGGYLDDQFAENWLKEN